MTRLLEPAAIFLGAFLLFQVQPLMGRYILPWFGGSPSVWTACMLFFQVLLLAGYAYAHWLATSLGGRRQGTLHAAALAISLLVLPVDRLLVKPASMDHPTVAVLGILTLSVGLPFFLLSATGPLIQRWSRLESPYRLYAYSNAGSLAGLLAYPFVVEPSMALHTQAVVWSAVYGLFALGFAWTAWSEATRVSAPAAVKEPLRARVGWALLAACPSALLVATTSQMSQEIAVSPFLWVVPLAAYLATFMIVFARPESYRRDAYGGAACVLVPLSCILVALGLRAPLWAHMAVYPLTLFVCAMVCHGELVLSRPEPGRLTSFYLSIAAGGALGGAAVALAAPAVFKDYDEFPLALAAVCLVLARKTSRVLARALIFAALIAAVTIGSGGAGATVAKQRNFFGILRVADENGQRLLAHGRVTHGLQFLDPEKRRWPTAYYGPESGIGLIMERHPRGRPLRAGIVGLGAGTVATYGRKGDLIRFYEINPDVERFSREFFTYRKDSEATVEVVLGDARRELEREPDGEFDILAIDAFSSDAVPAHLLTLEAADVYRQRLRGGGLLLFHITNQYLDLAPLIRGIAGRLQMDALRVTSKADDAKGVSASVWIILSPPRSWPTTLPVTAWTSADRPPSVWTDDRISLLPLLK
jgi:hypothetical protein